MSKDYWDLTWLKGHTTKVAKCNKITMYLYANVLEDNKVDNWEISHWDDWNQLLPIVYVAYIRPPESKGGV